MSANSKKSSKVVTHLAAQILKDPQAKKIDKSLAGSVLAQANTAKETGKSMEAKAAAALREGKSDSVTKTLAGSVVAQSNKAR